MAKGNEHNRIERDYIGETVRKRMKYKHVSMRTVAEQIEAKTNGDVKISYNQVGRIRNGENYTIDTLLTVCEHLGLEIILKEKS